MVNPTALALTEAAIGDEEWFTWHCRAIALTQPMQTYGTVKRNEESITVHRR
ncbi:hypothetical protein AVDCRST_MAG94-1161 [uncultured Leptolyngbya sp.]|uniref:Uncharacterized protein n=1 Tax=uncultured Leptolyngbya sp. TaxID=332963 RepID=A0A6J4KUX6_9CYAN|nr:hypothetical protein AVDCRST_MAG94-1161 [uncultured Leptolyngbya sp.]